MPVMPDPPGAAAPDDALLDAGHALERERQRRLLLRMDTSLLAAALWMGSSEVTHGVASAARSTLDDPNSARGTQAMPGASS